jgi:hypothetical protein
MTHQPDITDAKAPQGQLDVIQANDAMVHDTEEFKQDGEPDITWTEEERRSVVRKYDRPGTRSSHVPCC